MTYTLLSFLALPGQMNICAIPRFNPKAYANAGISVRSSKNYQEQVKIRVPFTYFPSTKIWIFYRFIRCIPCA